MRFSLIDLLIAIGVIAASQLAVDAALDAARARPPRILVLCLTTLLTTFLMITVVAFMYRRCRLLPLHLPTCPHCNKSTSGYRVVGGEWPQVSVSCGGCQGAVQLVFDRRAPLSPSSTESPILILQWPENLGIWKSVS